MNTTFTKEVTFDVEIEYNIKATSDIVNFESKNKNKKTERVTFSGEKLDMARSWYSYAVGFDLTIEQMLEVIFSSDTAFEDFTQWSDHPDSAAKDIFSKAFGKFILEDDRHWPVGGDSKEYTEKFFNDLNETADGLGYAKLV